MEWSNERLTHLVELLYAHEDVFRSMRKVLKDSEKVMNPFEAIYEDNHDRHPNLIIPDITIMFTIMSKCIDHYKKTPENINFVKNIAQDTFKEVEIFDYSKKRIAQILKRCCKNKVGLNSEEGKDRALELMEEFLEDFYFRESIIRSIRRHNSGIFELSKELQRWSNIITGCAPGAPEIIYGLREAEYLLDKVVTSKTELKFLEPLMPDGFVPGDVILFAAPTGTGKTTLTVQVAMDQCLGGGKRVLYFTYEEAAKRSADPKNKKGLRSELVARAVACEAAVSRDRSKAGLENLSDSEQKRIRNISRGKNRDNWVIIDMTVADRVNQTFEALKKQIREQNEKDPVDMVVIDPFWDMVQITAEFNHGVASPEIVRAESNKIAAQLKEFADEMEIPILVTHQVSAAGAKNDPKKVTSYDLAESRILMWKWTLGFIMTNKNEKEECALVRIKGRTQGGGGGQDTYFTKVKYDWDTSTFKPLEEEDVVSTMNLGNLEDMNLGEINSTVNDEFVSGDRDSEIDDVDF